MQKVKKTADYTIFQKRSGRHAVKDRKTGTLVHGADKRDILAREQLITLPRPRPVVEAAPADESAEAAA